MMPWQMPCAIINARCELCCNELDAVFDPQNLLEMSAVKTLQVCAMQNLLYKRAYCCAIC